MKLSEWLPSNHQQDFELEDYLGCEVLARFGTDKQHPFKHKYIFKWCIFKLSFWYYAIAWNENTATGWSFPVKRVKKEWALKMIDKSKHATQSHD